MKSIPIVFLIACNCVLPASAMAQHVHGVIELGIVVEGSEVAVSLNAPMSDVVGFEHEPKSDEQVAKINEAASLLADADAMFGLPQSADCEASDISLDGPGFVLERLEEDDHDAAEHSHDPHDTEHSHDHDSAHDHDDEHSHDHDDHEEHSEISANYTWACGDASNLDALELLFTKQFANVETIEVQVLTAAGAQVMKKEGRVASIPLSSP